MPRGRPLALVIGTEVLDAAQMLLRPCGHRQRIKHLLWPSYGTITVQQQYSYGIATVIAFIRVCTWHYPSVDTVVIRDQISVRDHSHNCLLNVLVRHFCSGKRFGMRTHNVAGVVVIGLRLMGGVQACGCKTGIVTDILDVADQVPLLVVTLSPAQEQTNAPVCNGHLLTTPPVDGNSLDELEATPADDLLPYLQELGAEGRKIK